MSIDKIQLFREERKEAIEKMSHSEELKSLSKKWILEISKFDYSYNMTWMGVPMLQLSTDIVALQEIIWEVKPDMIIETGLAYGGGIVFFASMMAILGNDGIVVGIDNDLRDHNRKVILNHPMNKYIHLIDGSSVDEQVVETVKELSKDRKKILVVLDSNHTHEHVLKELKSYSELVSLDSYIVVFDTIVEHIADEAIANRETRPWGKGNNPWTATQTFLKENDAFKIDTFIQNKIVLTAAPDGYLKRIK